MESLISMAGETVELITQKALTGLFWICLGFAVNRLLDRCLWNGVLGRGDNPVVPKVLSDLASVAIHLAAAAGLLHFVFDINVATIAMTSGFVALLLGYSAQNSLSDVCAGVGLNIARQFNVGDWIEIDEQYGRVVDMSWRFVAIETLYHNTLTIPNSVVAQAKVVNYNRPYHHRGVILPVLVEGGAAPDKVRGILVDCALRCSDVLKQPEPEAAVSEFRDNGILYELWYYTSEPDDWDIRNELLALIWKRLGEEGICISLSDVQIKDSPVAARDDRTVPRVDLRRSVGA